MVGDKLNKNVNQVSNIAAMTANVYKCIEQYPDNEIDFILGLLNMSRKSLFGCLIGLVNEPAVCENGAFRILEQGVRITVPEVYHYLQNNNKEDYKPKKAERILYLYNLLHRSIPYGGVNFDEIIKQYITLFEHSMNSVPKAESIRRMIYRDIDELEKIGILIERPATGHNKYCLRDKYLPKLPLEQASSLYVSMLLFEDTILDDVSNSVKQEFAKAFFKNSPQQFTKLNDRIHVVGDTLVNPGEFRDRFTKLVSAIVNELQINIIYTKLDGDVSERLLNPLGLVFKRGVWYLVAQLVNQKEYRTFRVDQILNVNLTDLNFIYPEDFSLVKHIGSSWGVYTNDEVQSVKLRFSPKVASRVKSLRYHRSQKLLDEFSDGSIIIGLNICGFIELKTWLLQWGKEVEVLEPDGLREQLIESAREILELYNYSK